MNPPRKPEFGRARFQPALRSVLADDEQAHIALSHFGKGLEQHRHALALESGADEKNHRRLLGNTESRAQLGPMDMAQTRMKAFEVDTVIDDVEPGLIHAEPTVD